MKTEELQTKFQCLVEEHKRILFKVCRAYCRNSDDRDDLAQEILLQLWTAFPRFDGRCLFATWMYRIALNVSISFVRRQQIRNRQTYQGDTRILETLAEDSQPPEDLLVLYQFIEELEPLNKALILLYLDGYSYQEIGETLGIRETNVATKLNRLKQTMRQKFAEVNAG